MTEQTQDKCRQSADDVCSGAGAEWQRCAVHFYRNVFSHVPRTKVREVAAMLKAIHAQENRDVGGDIQDLISGELSIQGLRLAVEPLSLIKYSNQLLICTQN